ncbi:hypothetical protein W97_04504 [Coniosporium apollinis CBS 100218]|uniref:DUF676 domain-containing protein n=1 Tax=Coniosporium apollinis (strain CBS 100218) TaxID=1168221 RepID=R7YUB7_CONA1|nr:uncharacterized protein W97_04504 [Coniosporium apollinis CBS 100218]EON65266.1 hypothetical protein W97_04504 [Coniosporium apollinis CBS 100218]
MSENSPSTDVARKEGRRDAPGVSLVLQSTETCKCYIILILKIPSIIMGRVAFIPSQTLDEAAAISDRSALHSPFRLFLIDLQILCKNLKYLPNTILPFRQLPPLPGVEDEQPGSWLDVVSTVILALLQWFLLLVTIPAILFLRGWMTIVCGTAVCTLVYLIQQRMWGPLIIESRVDLTGYKQHPTEKWFFINGIGTSRTLVQHTCNRLAATFKRPITGVHNRSYGIVGDILECLIQRCLSYNTTDVRVAYECLKQHILDPNIEKVVVLAHSQGGIVISLALDRMYAELPSRAISKLEIYTFGSAAAHFNNPLCSPAASGTLSPSRRDLRPLLLQPTTVIQTIEHYCNELDLVPRWGVLYNTRHCPGHRYAGRVFIYKGASGHLFNEHYLDSMFPLSSARATLTIQEEATDDSPTMPLMNKFLDQMVDVDTATAQRRARSLSVGNKDLIISRVPSRYGRRMSVQDDSQNAVCEGSGRTVRQLSKLWMYVGSGGDDGAEEAPSGWVFGRSSSVWNN